MERGFLEEVGVRQNALAGLVFGLLVGAGGIAVAWTTRESLLFPFPLYAALALVAVAVTAMFVTIALTLLRWALMARRVEDEETAE